MTIECTIVGADPEAATDEDEEAERRCRNCGKPCGTAVRCVLHQDKNRQYQRDLRARKRGLALAETVPTFEDFERAERARGRR